MMIIAHLSAEAYDALRSLADDNFTPIGRRRADGSWDVPLSQEVVDALMIEGFGQETINEAIIRLVAKRRGLQ